MKKFSIIFSLFFLFVFATSYANAANIPKCDDKKVLRWVEDIFFEKWWIVPRDKVNLQMEFLTETFSKPNERGCEVTLRSKLSSSGLKEMNGYLETWNKETGNSRPPSWLLNYSSESVTKLTFLLKYDLIKKDWFGQYSSSSPYGNQALVNYRVAFKGELLVAIQREKDRVAKEQERIFKEQDRAAMLQERAKAAERMKIENIEREKKSKELTEVSEKFVACVHENLRNKIKYPSASKRAEEEGVVVFHLEFIDGVYKSARIITSPYKRLGDAVLAVLPNLNCSQVEQFNGSAEMKFRFALE